MIAKSKLRILYGYAYFSSPVYGDVDQQNQKYFARLRRAGYNVEGFCLTLNPPGPRLSFKELNSRWRRRDPELLEMYSRLLLALKDKDVLINGSGFNLHPEFIKTLPVFTVFQCSDDPESSADLSKPAAKYYDLSLVINIAEVDHYRRWGVKHVEWIPHPAGMFPEFYNRDLTYRQILNGKRDIDLFMMSDRNSPMRRKRFDKLAKAFPDAHFYGTGWTRGILPKSQELPLLKRVKICPNIHNSTGPVNIRTYSMPANGVMLICDNKKYLSQIYKLGEEAVGFDSISECIQLCKYYLTHDDERRQIAAAGWKRAVTGYNEIAVFSRTLELINQYR